MGGMLGACGLRSVIESDARSKRDQVQGMGTTTSSKMKKQLESVIEGVPPKQLGKLLDFAEFLKSREDWAATRELLKDPGMARDVEAGRAQAARREGRAWRDVRLNVKRRARR